MKTTELFARSLIVSSLFYLTHTAYAEVKKFPADKLKKIQIDAYESKIEIKAAATKEVSVEYKKGKYKDDLCTLDINLKDNLLLVEVIDKNNKEKSKDYSNDKKGGRSNCEVDFVILTPEKVDVESKTIEGDMNLEKIQGNLEIAIVEGDVKISGKHDEVEIKTVSSKIKMESAVKELSLKMVDGELEFKGTAEESTINLVNGVVKADFTEIVKKGFLKIRSVSGDGTIKLPKEMKIKSDLKSFSGNLKNYFGDSKDGEFEISMNAVSGDLLIEKK